MTADRGQIHCRSTLIIAVPIVVAALSRLELQVIIWTRSML